MLDSTGYKEQINETSLKVSIFENSKLIHFKAIFDGINEAINMFRPMQNLQSNFPWSNIKIIPDYNFSEVPKIYAKVQQAISSWSSSKAGPLP